MDLRHRAPQDAECLARAHALYRRCGRGGRSPRSLADPRGQRRRRTPGRAAAGGARPAIGRASRGDRAGFRRGPQLPRDRRNREVPREYRQDPHVPREKEARAAAAAPARRGRALVNREDVRRNLPWYAAGTLTAEESAAVELELARSPDLKRELEEWRAIESAAAAPRAGEPEFRGHVAEAWARIEAHERAERQAKARGPLAVLGGWLRDTWVAMPVGGRVALAAQFALLVAVGVSFELSPRPQPGFQTLAGSNAP